MGKKDKERPQQEELLKTLGDFTSKENWDKFFSIRGSDDSFEWYAEWPQLKDPLLFHLSTPPTNIEVTTPSTATGEDPSKKIQILVPGCGNSRLSEHLYDAGFHNITNVDFSKVVISDMLRRNVRLRPEMRWRVMDMTDMQFPDETIDVVVDKGGLDALMEPKLGPKLGNQYMSEVKRVLKFGGKFICLTLAESHVLDLLFPRFRYGWKMSLHAIPVKPSAKPCLQTFMVIAEKGSPLLLQHIWSSFSHSSLNCHGAQARGVYEALESENKIRTKYSNGSDIVYSLEDLKLGAKGDLSELNPGRRVLLTLGEPGVSRFYYEAVLLDALQQSDPFLYHCGVFLVPKTRAREWLFSSEEGQWMVVESSNAARLIMVLLDSSQTSASMDDIQMDLSPLVKQLAPCNNESEVQIPFMAASDGIKQRKIVYEVTSALTGPIIVDDVVYEKIDDDLSRLLPSNDLIFRRLTFQRTEGLVQSEALLMRNGSNKSLGKAEENKTQSYSKSRKRGTPRRTGSHGSPSVESSNDLKVDHNYLASSYHTGIISGFMLISSYLEKSMSAGDTVKALVIGLGAGLLPMFLHRCLSFFHIQVVELDPVVLDLARDYFGFVEDERLKVHVTDGIQFVREAANTGATFGMNCGHENDTNGSAPNGGCTVVDVDGKGTKRIDILIVDVDSSDCSSGLTCPASDFVEESFLLTVKKSLSEHGLFVVNLVSRSQPIKDLVFERLKLVFGNIFCLQLEGDVNEVVFALNSHVCISEDCFPEACDRLEKLLLLQHPEWNQRIIDTSKKIKAFEATTT